MFDLRSTLPHFLAPFLVRGRMPRSGIRRLTLSSLALGSVALVGFLIGISGTLPSARAQSQQVNLEFNTLRLHGYPAANHPSDPPHANQPGGAGSATQNDPLTGRVPEDAPYTQGEGPFDPLSPEAPRMDFATWNPAWISERLGEPALGAMWPGLKGIDEVSAGSNIRAGGLGNASEKVWLRHWYEPQHLDKDLNADGRLTDTDGDGTPDAPINPAPTAIDEWYHAIMTELTYMLVDNDPLPQANPRPSELHRSAPRPICGTVGGTRIVFPIGTDVTETDPNGPAVGYGLTRLDADFDGAIDMVNISDEESLPDELGGTQIDFDGDNTLDPLDPDGNGLSCDEMVVMHTDGLLLRRGAKAQFLDHYVEVRSITDSSVSLDFYYTGDLVPRLIQRRSIGIGATALSGDVGPVQVVAPGGNNLGTVPVGPWFLYVQDVDPRDGTALVVLGRALGAPCAAMESAPGVTNRTPGGPWFLKRLYVDGHEYNVVAIQTCGRESFQYLTLRAPVPKVPVTIEQHSVRLQPYPIHRGLPLPPPFNYEHTILEDIVALEGFDPVVLPATTDSASILRPKILYMGGPIGPVPPVLGAGEKLPYTGNDPNRVVGPYDDVRALRWFYTKEDVDPAFLGQLREKFGARAPGQTAPPAAPNGFFYNEQIFTLPWHYTEFVLPNYADPGGDPAAYDPDNYLVTTAWTNPTARWRRWGMPNGPVPSVIPPTPPDLEINHTPDGGFPFGSPRRAAFEYDPDTPGKLFYDGDGVRLFGGQPQPAEFPCAPERPRRSQLAGAGDLTAFDPLNPPLPVEVAPYTDPFAPFNPQHPHAPRGDSLTFNPAYMDEFRNFNERLRLLYTQLSNNVQNAREKVYHRIWYEPEYVTKIRFGDDCSRDLKFPAVMQEFTYLYVDTTDNPSAAPPGHSRFAFPIGTGPRELPEPNPGGSLPAGGQFGYGLTNFDANFDGFPEAVTVHSEETLRDYLDAQWQSNRPIPPGPPPPAVPGPVLDLDGDGNIDDLDADATPLSGNEMVVFAVESLTLDLDANTPEGPSAMLLDHLVTLENVTRGSRAQLRFWFTGGNGTSARPEQVGGVRSLEIGDAAIVDRFQDRITIVSPNGQNTGVDGAWFVFMEDVATDDDRVTVTVGRALGASHSAIDDGAGGHDLTPGDPWFLKRFYVDGHEYNVVAVMTQPVAGAPGDDLFQFITIRTPVPKGNFFNPQDTLFQQGYFLDNLAPQMSVLPPFNTDHTIVEDIERIERGEFAERLGLGACVGDLRAAPALVETITAETVERRLGTQLREIWSETENSAGGGTILRWETDQLQVTPYQYTEFEVPEGQQYLLTSNWTSPVSRLSFYGCTLAAPGPFPSGTPGITQDQLAQLANGWAPPFNAIPPANRTSPGGIPYYDARIGPDPVRVKFFYDPRDDNDPFLNPRTVPVEVPQRLPRLAVEKRLITRDPAMVGDPVSFEIVVKNTGNTQLTDVDLGDSFETAFLDFVSATPAPINVNEAGGVVRWDNLETSAPGGSFEPGESIVITVNFRATAETPDPDRADNTARAAAQGGTVVADPAAASVEINNPPAPALRITKRLTTANPTTIGSLVVFEVAVINVGNTVLTDVDVSDTYLTAFLDFASAIPAPTTVDEGAGALTWNNVEAHAPGGTFDPGESVLLTVNFMAVAETPDPDRARNTARVTAAGGTVAAGPVTAEVEINRAPAPSLQITKQLETVDPALVGDAVSFRLTVTNNGNTVLADVDVGDTFDTAYLDFVSAVPAQSAVNEGAGTLAWNDIEGGAPGGTFDPGESIVLRANFVATAETPDPVKARNTARATANQGAVTADPSTADVEINPRPTARLRITKTLTTPDPATVNGVVTFQIAVINVGDTVLANVDVTDSFETGNLDFLSASPAQTSANEAAGTVFWDNIEGLAPGGTFDPGESIVLTVNFTATAATQDPDRADNAASVSADGGAVNAGPAVARVRINPAPSAALRITKRLLTPDPTLVGANVQFEVRVFNAGGTVLSDVDVTDTYETESVDFASASPVQTGVNDAIGIINWNNIEGNAPGGSFDPGESIVLTVNFTATGITNDPAKMDNSASVVANGGTVTAGPATAAVEINDPPTTSGAPTAVGCNLLAPLQIRVTWTDGSNFENEFQIQVSINGTPFALLATVASTSQATTGTVYTFDTPLLIASSTYEFRVRARNSVSNQVSPFSTVSSTCTTGTPGAGVLGCVAGKVQLQGQSNHSGAMIFAGGVPIGTVDPDGSFEICGLPEGIQTITAAGRCSIKAVADGVMLDGGQTLALANMALPGGDVNDDEQVDLFDLVRVGADYRSQPPTDAEADCNADGAVNLFDLVMVGSNYRKSGPMVWGMKSATTQAAAQAQADARPDGASGSISARTQAPRPTAARSSVDWSRVAVGPRGDAGGAPVALKATAQDDGTLVVEVTARKMDALYGADFTLSYDPERLKVVDALPSDPGIQIQPGAAWGPSPFIPLNEVDRDTDEVRFAASLLKPAAALTGDVVIATIRFEVLGGDPAGAYALTAVKLADPLGGRIAVEWNGADIVPAIDRGALEEQLYLPALHKAVALQGSGR